MKLSCQEHLLPGDGILEKWEFAQAAGFDGIELRGMEDWNSRLDDLRGAREQGVVFSSVCLISDRFIGDFDPTRRREATDHMKDLLSGIADLGGTGAVTPAAYGLASKRLPPFNVPRTEEEDRRVLLDALEKLGESIRAAGDYLAHVHLADSSRLQPGTAHTDFAGAFAALREIGFEGFMAMECGIRGNPEEALPESVRHLRSLMG